MLLKYQKKLKIIFVPLVILFIANFFYFSTPAKAADICTWMIENAATNGGLCVKGILGAGSRSESYATCNAQLGAPPTTSLCCCKPETPAASSGVNASMPKLNIPDINLQITIPGLNLTKGNAIECKEVNGVKTCNFPWIGEYIAGIYKYAIGIVGILAAVVLMIGGVIWIVAGGSATMIGEAKAWIGASLTGLVIALCSYVILYQVNPALVGFSGLNIQMVEKIKELVSEKTGGTANQYKNMPCPWTELSNGEEVEIFATGYYFPEWGNDHRRLCEIHMQCSCPAGTDPDNSHNCNDVYPGRTPPYQPCLPFPNGTAGINYCNSPEVTYGDIAVPSCIPKGTKLCVNGVTTYTAKDSGGDIQGRRIDIWGGIGSPGLNAALAATGIKKMKLGACK